MIIKVVFLAVLLGGTTAYEMSPRANRIRFPSNEPPPQNYFGPQIFAAESQDAPLIRTAPHFNGHMFNIVPQVPSHSKPFGEENKKGFSQGLIYNGGLQDEFYHPVPPPQFEMHPMKNVIKFPSSFNGQKRLPERHRFSPQRHNMHSAGKPFGHPAPQKLFNPAMEKPENFNHEFMEVFPSFKRPIQNFNDGRFHEQRPLKESEDIENFKKPVHSRPHINAKPIYKQQYEQDYPEDSMDYHDYEKRRPEVTQEKLRVQKEPNYYMAEQNFRTSEPNYFMAEQNFRPENHKTEYEDYSQKSDQKVSGEWIPINAPEGALPAKSYEIPAPDLSVRYQNDDYDERAQKPTRVRVQKRPSNVVYGGRKKVGNEEVVSASVMVKQ